MFITQRDIEKRVISLTKVISIIINVYFSPKFVSSDISIPTLIMIYICISVIFENI